jgi:acyl dehydratase
LSIASGLAWQTGILDGTVIAFREVNEWKFVKPVFIGDTIYVEMEVRETKALPRIGGGSVTITWKSRTRVKKVSPRSMDRIDDEQAEVGPAIVAQGKR